MADSAFRAPDLTTLARLDTFGLQVTGQFLEPDGAVLSCRIVDRADRCGRCGGQGDRGTTPLFRNLINYIARPLLEPAGSDPTYTFDCDEPLTAG